MIVVRHARESDIPFIIERWKNSVLDSEPYRAMDRITYYESMRRRIARLLSKSEVRVACAEDNEDTLFGFAVFEPAKRIGHFRFVRKDFRGELHLGRALVDGVKIDVCTHRLGVMSQAFNPFLLEAS